MFYYYYKSLKICVDNSSYKIFIINDDRLNVFADTPFLKTERCDHE